MFAKRLGPPGRPQMQRRLVDDAAQPGMRQRRCRADYAPLSVSVVCISQQIHRCGRGNGLSQRLVRRWRGRRVEREECGQHAVEALGFVADEELEQAGIVEPRGRLVRQALHPRVGRVNVFEAEPPDGRRLQIA